MELESKVSICVNGVRITDRQLQSLMALKEHGSKASAARSLGISAPVLHRYLQNLESSTGLRLIRSSPRGTEMTDDARHIINEYNAIDNRLRHRGRFRAACSPVTEHLMMAILSSLPWDLDLVVSDDENNVRDLQAGLVDLIVLDDPQFLYDLEDVDWEEVGETSMVHVDRGPRYMRYRYGAQRIAYQHLDSQGIPYSVERTTLSLDELMEGGLSFFVDEILLLRRNMRVRSSTDPAALRHSINAVYRQESEQGAAIVRSLRSRL
ncbi:MAG: LysR family transcriptional regulator [Candidatus Methanomethylophilaceae archaeon]|nr:LysR family transcriptional regulator [Candidatus Methanomethylophilaceae archaeon]